jgi:bifunctional isochorismate lyase/aryl carrier protein
MPSAAELPQNRVDWRPDPRRAALLVHDMQRHFLAPFAADAEPIQTLMANVAALRDRCGALGIPVVFSAQPGGQTLEQRGLLQDFWGDGIAAGPDAQAIVDELAPRDGERLMTKWRYSAFVRTDLLESLRDQGRDQLLICGIYGHIGCLMTACHAFMQEIEPFFVADAVADFSLEDHRQAISWAARRCAVVTTTAGVLDALPAPAAGGIDREAVRAAVLRVLDEPPAVLADDENLVDLGLDSLGVMALIGEWRDAGAAVDFEDLVEVEPTVGAWWPVIDAAARRAAASR